MFGLLGFGNFSLLMYFIYRQHKLNINFMQTHNLYQETHKIIEKIHMDDLLRQKTINDLAAQYEELLKKQNIFITDIKDVNDWISLYFDPMQSWIGKEIKELKDYKAKWVLTNEAIADITMAINKINKQIKTLISPKKNKKTSSYPITKFIKKNNKKGGK